MKTTTTTRPTRPRRYRLLLWLVALPLVVFFGLVAVLAWQERVAASAVDDELQRLQAAGLPDDDQSLQRWYEESTFSQGTAQWLEILQLVEHSPAALATDIDQLPIIGTAELPDRLQPGDPWPEEATVAEYLQLMRPVIDKITAATEHPTPVWMPIEFDGFGTLLPEIQSARSVYRLLHLETIHGLYHEQPQRAVAALQALRGTLDAMQLDVFIVGELVTIAGHGILHDGIARALDVPIWQDDDLLAIDALLAERELSQRWHRMIAGERAMALGSLSGNRLASWENQPEFFNHLYRLPSLRVPLLDAYRQIESLGDDRDSLVSRSRALGEQLEASVGRSPITRPGHLLVGLLLPSVVALAGAVERDEDSRRLARVAVAVKRFQLRHGRWPSGLDELSADDASQLLLSTISGGPFGFEVDGDVCYVWGYHRHEASRVPAQRPVPDPFKVSHPVIRIR